MFQVIGCPLQASHFYVHVLWNKLYIFKTSVYTSVYTVLWWYFTQTKPDFICLALSI